MHTLYKFLANNACSVLMIIQYGLLMWWWAVILLWLTLVPLSRNWCLWKKTFNLQILWYWRDCQVSEIFELHSHANNKISRSAIGVCRVFAFFGMGSDFMRKRDKALNKCDARRVWIDLTKGVIEKVETL